jgi:hypothetical protein
MSRGLPSDAPLSIPSDAVTLCDKNGAHVDMNDSQIIMHHYFQWDNKGNRGCFKPNTTVTMVLRLDYGWFQNFDIQCDTLLGARDVKTVQAGKFQRKRKRDGYRTAEGSDEEAEDDDDVGYEVSLAFNFIFSATNSAMSTIQGSKNVLVLTERPETESESTTGSKSKASASRYVAPNTKNLAAALKKQTYPTKSDTKSLSKLFGPSYHTLIDQFNFLCLF